ncbi:Uma2 family endonuclease [Myxacorys almedinensis A]|uniref:Uma2 family endonuclease n=2 Tax=Myxacorys TaxID=2056239 RepID=A0A8J8CIK1_9CYAN|nr:Uma2 family endonuclease [Myxacorys almedinensis]NDJ17928.1 Uma2 family endonuclease [Myxacorys almedinensis A]
MTISTLKWTIDRYHQAVEAGVFNDVPVELLHGELIEMPPEGVPHASLSSDAGDYLRDKLGNRAKVREGHPITLPNNSEPEPDLAIVNPDTEIYRSHHPYPENVFWVVEYSNTSLQKDLEVKSKIYAEVGIVEYWVINLKTSELIVFRDPVDGEYRSRQTFTTGTICPLSFPDVQIDVVRLSR